MTDNLDVPIWGAAAIGRAAGIFKCDATGKIKFGKDGEPEVDVRKVFYLIGTGAIAAKHVRGLDRSGRQKARGQLVSTPRLIYKSLLGDDAAA